MKFPQEQSRYISLSNSSEPHRSPWNTCLFRGLKVKMAPRNVQTSSLISAFVCQLNNDIRTAKSEKVQLRFSQPKCPLHGSHDFAAIFHSQRMRGSDVMAKSKENCKLIRALKDTRSTATRLISTNTAYRNTAKQKHNQFASLLCS